MRNNGSVTNREVTLDDEDVLVSKTDPKGIITYCNTVFMKIAGFSEFELLGQSHNIVRHPDMPPDAFRDLWETVKSGREWHGIVKNRCKNGDFYWVDATVTPDYDSLSGKLTGYISTRRKPTRQQIADAGMLYRQMLGNARGGK